MYLYGSSTSTGTSCEDSDGLIVDWVDEHITDSAYSNSTPVEEGVLEDSHYCSVLLCTTVPLRNSVLVVFSTQ